MWRSLSRPECGALSQDPNGEGRGNRGSIVWMLYVDRSPGTLRQTPHGTPPGLAWHHRGTRPDHRMASYNRVLEMTRCESIETTSRTRRLLWTGALIRMSDGRLRKRIMFGNLEGAVRRGRGGKESGPVLYRATSGRLAYRGIGKRWRWMQRCGLSLSRRAGEGLWPRGGNKR